MAYEYDLVILGGGTGGYVAAIRASQLGLKTAIVEKEKLGGTCLHKGCIPSKALLRSAEVYSTIKKSAEFGINIEGSSVDFIKVQERKRNIVEQLHKGVKHLIKKGKIDVFEGNGRILGPSIFSPIPGTISVEMIDGQENSMLIPKNVIIATGSIPKTIPGVVIDGEFVLNSEDALNMERLPSSIIIVGGGVIGIEWASMLLDFGVEVTLIEAGDRILPFEDQEVSREMTRLLKKRGLKIVTSAKLIPEKVAIDKGVQVTVEIANKTEIFSAEKMLLSIGRVANVDDIGLQNTEIQVENGTIVVNSSYQTKESHIYAIGDVIGGLQLAHVASQEGILAVEHIAGIQVTGMDYKLVPKCIYSKPEIASIGLTEEQAKELGYKIKVGKFPFQAIGKALVYGETDGFVKLIAHAETDDIVGVHMIGPHVTDMISEAGLASLLDATPWEIAKVIRPHPSLSEVMGEAALALDGKAIHT